MPLLIHVEVHRERQFWVIEIPSIDAVTQAYRWEQIRPMAQDCAAVVLNVPPQRITVGAVRRAPEPDWRSW